MCAASGEKTGDYDQSLGGEEILSPVGEYRKSCVELNCVSSTSLLWCVHHVAAGHEVKHRRPANLGGGARGPLGSCSREAPQSVAEETAAEEKMWFETVYLVVVLAFNITVFHELTWSECLEI